VAVALTVELSTEHAAFVREHVESGRYASADEVMEAALRLLDERDQREYLLAALRIGREQGERGEVREWTPELHQEIRRAARRKAQEGHRPHPDVLP
jgi:antitoxin ParD1/3/4